MILNKKNYIKLKEDIICNIKQDDLFYAEYNPSKNSFYKHGYFYIGNKNGLAMFYGDNDIFDNSGFGKFIYKSLFNEDYNFIEYENGENENIDCIVKNRIINREEHVLKNIKTLEFINHIYRNQNEHELFFTIKKNRIDESLLNIKFKNQYFSCTRNINFNIKYNEFEDFIDSLTKYKGVDYYKNEEGYHFILLNSYEEDLSMLKKIISNEDIYSVYLDDNIIYLKYKNTFNKSIVEIFPALSYEDIKNAINESNFLTKIDSYYYISNNL